jgi:protein SCO1/2
VGPDLAGVTQQRERAWLERWLAAPDKVLAEGDPLALALLARYKNIPMPNLHLSEQDVAALLAYLEMYPARPLNPATVPANGGTNRTVPAGTSTQ